MHCGEKVTSQGGPEGLLLCNDKLEVKTSLASNVDLQYFNLIIVHITRHQLSEFVLIVPKLRTCLATYIFWVKVTRNVCAISGTETVG
jgi:hypothetical protein